MSDVRVQVTYRMWKADRKVLRRYAIQNDMTVQEFIECAVAKEMMARGLTAPRSRGPEPELCYRNAVVTQSPDGLWRVAGADSDGSAWLSVGFTTNSEAHRWLDRRNEEVTTPSEKRADYRWQS